MSARRFGLLVLVGYLLAQAVWILTVPPFRGIDEFDHSFRAAGVASGQWKAPEAAENGRGMIVTVPRSLVDAASAQCDWLPYTGEDNCYPIDHQGDGQVTIATSAGLYNPAWYAVIGLPTLVLEGSAALYGMRILTALLCALGVAVAAWALGLSGAGRWTRFAFLASLTPVLAYSTMVPGPNGPEIVAGLLLWTCFLTLFKPEADRRHDAVLLPMATVAGVLLATVRSIGPMWLGLIVLSVVASVGPRAVVTVVLRQPIRWGVASGTVVVAVLGGVWWTLNAGLTNASPDILETGPDDDFSLGTKPLAWTLQMIAAFPLRRDFAPPAVYLCGALVIGFLLTSAIVKSSGTRRLLLMALVLTALVLPIVMTLLTVSSQGAIWQGRYQLPWATGILVVSGIQLDRRDFLGREGARPLLVGGGLLALSHAWSVWGVAHRETTHEVSAVDTSWITLPPLLLAVGCFATWLTLFVLAGREQHSQGPMVTAQ